MNARHQVYSAARQRTLLRRGPAASILALAFLVLSISSRLYSQSASDAPDTLHGTVINRITHEPIPRALVVSPDQRFATLTDDQGQFEFTLPKSETPKPALPGSSNDKLIAVQFNWPNRPSALSARKPGYLQDNDAPFLPVPQDARDLRLSLVPEAIITGHISLSATEAPDSIQVQLFSREVRDGRAHWNPAGIALSKSTGEFRFAGLRAGTYKLVTGELLDRDPVTFDPRGQLYGYPPVYYQQAADFGSATTIEVSPGQTVQTHISLVKRPYYNVKIAVPNAPPGLGLNVNVYSQGGGNGPGYSLGYNSGMQRIEGMLPDGVYTIEATGFAPASSGIMTLAVKGAPVEDARMMLMQGRSIAVNVTEEFTSKEPETTTVFSNGRRTFPVLGPRRYLNISLESADEFSAGRTAFLRPPKGPEDDSLAIDDVPPGRYWVRVQTSRGYAASIRSGSADLQHEPLTVAAGGAAPPIEITMRDDFATVAGNVDGIAQSPSASDALQPQLEIARALSLPGAAPAHLYCIPLVDSNGEANEISVSPDGSFSSQPMPPGDYRLLAFDRQQPQLEYRNPEVMKAYDNQGPVVRVAGGQTEHVTLHLISTNEWR